MELSVNVDIEKPIKEVWKAITDFKNCTSYIKSIIKLDIIEEPKGTLIGFKWKETRMMFGKEATETMWITDYAKNKFYQTKAESHGSVYVSKLMVEPNNKNTKLTMSFSSEPQTLFVKIFSFCTGFMLKGFMKKELLKDLNDIKFHLENIK